MGLTTGTEINRRAVLLMQDSGITATAGTGGGIVPAPDAPGTPANVRWTVEEMLKWISDGQRAIVLLRPNSNNKVAEIPLVAGPRQRLPDDGWLLLTANANTDGASNYGRGVTLATFDAMNRQLPNWRADAKSKLVYNYMFDLTDQKAFYIWPPNDGTGHLEINYSAQPPEMTDLDQTIAIDDIFVPVLVDYVCMRCSTKDAEFSPDGLGYAQFFQGLFTTGLFGKDSAEKEQNPDAALPERSNR